MTSAGAPPVAPAQGIAVAPTALVASTLATIPPPTLPNGGPVPWRTPWVVILNSSAFTLVVSSGGGTVTQIAAFTSDKVFVQATGGAPVTVLPTPGSGTPALGQDSTAYATWYADEPPGQYPAALGSGAANFLLTSTIIPLQNLNTPAGGAVTTFGPFSTAGFGGLSLFVHTNGAGTQPIEVDVDWMESTGTTVVASRRFILPVQAAGQIGQLMVSLANLGPQVRVHVGTLSLANPYQILATLTTQAVEVFSGLTGFGNLIGDGVLLYALNNVQVLSQSVYAGPASLVYSCSDGYLFSVTVEALDFTNVWRPLLVIDQGTGPSNAESIPITLPANPLRLTTALVTPSAATIQAALLVDGSRAGG
jgi:hypothetical protein